MRSAREFVEEFKFRTKYKGDGDAKVTELVEARDKEHDAFLKEIIDKCIKIQELTYRQSRILVDTIVKIRKRVRKS